MDKMNTEKRLPEKFYEVLQHEGVVAIVSWGENEPHVVNTWNSYLVVTGDGHILIPAYGMRKTEKNVNVNNRVKLTLGSKEVMGYRDYQGTGFLIDGTASYIESGAIYDMMKEKFSFLTRVLDITVTDIKQTI
jgi:predicted pyridoxine 5'-phosphate oxidase superfamily flavin-nucleotide-binding protein